MSYKSNGHDKINSGKKERKFAVYGEEINLSSGSRSLLGNLGNLPDLGFHRRGSPGRMNLKTRQQERQVVTDVEGVGIAVWTPGLRKDRGRENSPIAAAKVQLEHGDVGGVPTRWLLSSNRTHPPLYVFLSFPESTRSLVLILLGVRSQPPIHCSLRASFPK